MLNQLKAGLIKLSRNYNKLIIGEVIFLILTLSYSLYAIFTKSCELLDFIIFIWFLDFSFSATVKTIGTYQEEVIYENELKNLILSNPECVREYIFTGGWLCSLLFVWNSFIAVIFLIITIIAVFTLPHRISKKFKEKIVK